MPKRTRNGTAKNGKVVIEEGVCEGNMPVCPFGKNIFNVYK